MDKFRQSVAKLLMLWATLKGWQKLTVLLASCGVFGMLIFIVLLGSSQSYVPLFSGLEMDDQVSIINYLKENKIPYKFESDRNVISVPKNQIDDVKFGLIQADLPRGGGGYKDLDNTSWGQSGFQQSIAYLRALEGELARTIKRFDAVEDAIVRVVLPKPQLFLEQQVPSSASVLLKLRGGYRMNHEQVKSVMHLVSRSVQGLLPENITVVDTLGTIYTDMIDSDFFYSSDRQTVSSIQKDLEKQQERDLETKVRVRLERVHGIGKVVVGVNVELDFDKMKETSIKYSPSESTGKSLPVSQQTMEESWTGTGANSGGAPGTTSNIPGYSTSTGSVTGEYNKTENTTNYQPSKNETEKIITPGSIKRLTAAVYIDGELNEQKINDARETVSSIIGLNEARGDILVVKSMPFSTELADSLMKILEREELKKLIITSVISFILFLLGSVLVTVWWRKRKAMLAMSRTSQEARHIPTIQEMLTSPDMIAAQGEISVLEEQIKAYARSNPKEVANLVNEWLSED